jgi:hypothetical protein
MLSYFLSFKEVFFLRCYFPISDLFQKESLFSLPISFQLANCLLFLWEEGELNSSQTMFGLGIPSHSAHETVSKHSRFGGSTTEM